MARRPKPASIPPEPSQLPVGTVLTRARQGVLVRDEDERRHWCRVPGKGSRLGMPAAGDRVRYQPSTGTQDGRIHAIEPRRTHLERWVYGRRKDVAANIEQALILATPRDPVVSPRLVDRMLVGCSIGGLEPVIVLNKLDVIPRNELLAWAACWERVFPILAISAVNGEGLADVHDRLRHRVSLLLGASGVGKSTLLNALITGLDLDTSAVSDASGRGVHTTTATFLYPVPGGGTVADTPGMREFHPALEDIRTLDRHFPEFQPYREQCQFDDCLHLPDTRGCAVRHAMDEGAVHPDRYLSYQMLRKSLLEGPKRGRQHAFDPSPLG